MLLFAADAAHGSHAMLLTVATAIAAGVMLIVTARRFDIPAIVLLLIGGVLLGPQVTGLVQPAVLGDGLLVIVSLSIGLILFEGGLTLDVSGYQSAPQMIKRLLSLGVLITWACTTGIIYLLHDVSFEIALVSGSLVIVTGPTVIAPLLKRIKVNAKLHSILHWEGVLIDPVGVFIALLCFEFVVPSESAFGPIASLAIRVTWGLAVGFAGGGLAYLAVRRRWIPEDIINVFALGTAVATFCIAEAVITEAGLLAVTVAGFVFGLAGGSKIKQVRAFKGELTDLLIGTLFILLAARLEFALFGDFGLMGALSVLAVILLVRPLNIMCCSVGADISRQERLFLSWVAPRGIVAASMASLIAIRFGAVNDTTDVGEGGVLPFPDPRFVETFTYSVIIVTILLQGSTAGWMAGLLDVRRPDPKGWLIVGANALSRTITSFLHERHPSDVVIVDTNARAIADAREQGLHAIVADGRDTELAEREDFQDIGNLLAVTDNEDLNIRLCQTWAELLGPNHVFRCNPNEADPKPWDEDDPTGHVVWPRLPKPSLIAAELNRGEASTLQATGYEPAFAQLAAPIITVRGNSVSFDAPTQEDADSEVPVHSLYLQRRADYLVRSLRPELITTLDADNLQTLFQGLVDLVVQLFPSISREGTVAELLDRESSFPTALGGGVAVPHAYSPDLDTRICAISRVPQGIDFKAPDEVPVRLVFLLLSPQGDPEGHLATLADIARLVIDPSVRQQLLDASTPLDVISLIRRRPTSDGG